MTTFVNPEQESRKSWKPKKSRNRSSTVINKQILIKLIIKWKFVECCEGGMIFGNNVSD